jgi:hypothetical protein
VEQIFYNYSKSVSNLKLFEKSEEIVEILLLSFKAKTELDDIMFEILLEIV